MLRRLRMRRRVLDNLSMTSNAGMTAGAMRDEMIR
jgi:hypothetical protein